METLISIRKISKSFGENKILKDISFDINEGQKIIIKGPSGSGKSTLLNIIGLLEDFDEGEIEWFGKKNIKPNSKKAMEILRTEISYLFQNYALIDNETIYQNLEICMKGKNKNEKKEVISLALRKVGLEGYESRYVYTLSGGEQARVALARLILKPCKVVLADEPTGNLDDKNAYDLMEILDKLKDQGKAILIVTHDSRLINNYDLLVEINKGEKICVNQN